MSKDRIQKVHPADRERMVRSFAEDILIMATMRELALGRTDSLEVIVASWRKRELTEADLVEVKKLGAMLQPFAEMFTRDGLYEHMGLVTAKFMIRLFTKKTPTKEST